MFYGTMDSMTGSNRISVSDFSLWDEEEDTTVVETLSSDLGAALWDCEPPATWATGRTTAELVAIAHSEDLEATGVEWAAIDAAVEVAA